MLSILIPTYNHCVYDLVKELHAQALKLEVPFEILVIDDHSTLPLVDNDKIVAFSNVIFSKLNTNIGRSAIRGLLSDKAKYDHLLFLDADVLPVSNAFLSTYIKTFTKTRARVIFGGIAYEEKVPPIENRLRWKYGKNREVKLVQARKKTPYFVISQNLFIDKSSFTSINTFLDNFYGDDLILSQELKRNQIEVEHIDNPVFHLGLEPSIDYLKKALSAIDTIVILEEQGKLDNDLTRLQQSYVRLKRWKLNGIFSTIISPWERVMERNFCDAKPNLFWFDLYRLNYYSKLKANKK